MPVVLMMALGSVLLQVAPAGAVPRHGPPPTRARVRGNTEMTVTNWFPGQGVTGFIADANNPFDPVVDGYPASNPTTEDGFSPKDEGFAGVIHGTPPGGGATLNLYCIDINTDTWGGIGYALGTWGASNVRNVGYVARILNEYYPHTNEPTKLANGAAGLPQPNGRRRAGGHLVLQRSLRAEHLRHVARHRRCHREQDQSRRAACPAAAAQPHHHPCGRERPPSGARTVHG